MTYEVQVAKWAVRKAGEYGTAHYKGKKDGEDRYGVLFSVPGTPYQQSGEFRACDLLFDYAGAHDAFVERLGA